MCTPTDHCPTGHKFAAHIRLRRPGDRSGCDATFIIIIIIIVIIIIDNNDGTWPRAEGTADTGMRGKVPEEECRSQPSDLRVPDHRSAKYLKEQKGFKKVLI